MPYPTIDSLPPAVKDKIKSPKRRRQWMHVWNSSYDRHGDESRAFAEAWATAQKGVKSMDQFNFFLPITKVDKERRTVSGYASTPTLDLDGEIVSLDAVKKALPGYWEWRNIREMHTNSAVGVAKEANVDGTGLFLTAKIIDDDAWQKCIEQVYKGFSIGGKKLAKQGNTITDIDLVEISVVDRPANPDCRFEVQKRRRSDLDGNNSSVSAHLVKVARTPEEKLLRKVQQAMEQLAKSGTPMTTPPAARDGFSLPAKVKKSKKCAAHGLKNCSMCMGKVGPAKDDPKTPEDNNPFVTKKGRGYILREAQRLGVELPDGWTKKLGRALVHKAAIERAFDKFDLDNNQLNKRYKGPVLELTPTSTTTNYDLEGDIPMDPNNLDNVIESLMKRGATVTKAQHIEIAKANIKKARAARKSAMDSIKSAHAMHKSAYLSKAGKPPKAKPAPDDDDDFDHEGAMEKLGKAYQSLSTLKTFMKSASNHIAKAAGRSGQRGQEVNDGDAPWYTPPAGIHDMAPSELATAGPGGDNHGSTPPLHSIEARFPGKSAKKGAISQEVAELMARTAAAEAEARLLKAMPSGSRKPAAFDVTKFSNGNDTAAVRAVMDGVDPSGLVSDEEHIRKSAVGRLIGNMITNGTGKSVFDPGFHGSAGG